jgi:hypothetical protein
MLRELQSVIALALIGYLSVGSAAAPVIGVINARGSFRIDNAKVYQHSTLFDGNSIETEKVPSELQLNSGGQLLLDPASRGMAYRDRIVLEKGAGRLKGANGYRIEARTLRISPAGPDSAVQVALNKANHVQVMVFNGAAQVSNAEGVVVANVGPGKALDLEPQAAGAAAPTKLTGCLKRKDGKFILTDETTNVTVELQGAELDKQVGKVIEVTGAAIPGVTPVAGATQVISVSDLKETDRKCAPGGAAAGAGVSTAATVTIIGGVAAAATVAGLVLRPGAEEKAPASP